jgi:hypothetical protein
MTQAWIRRASQAMLVALLVGSYGISGASAESRPREKAKTSHIRIERPGRALMMTRSGRALSGRFAIAGSLVTFSARHGSPRLSTVRVAVNGVVLEASLFERQRTIKWTGHNRALFLSDRRTLIALSDMLEGQLTSDDLPVHERLLARSMLLWAEAPVGLPLSAQVVHASEGRPNNGQVRRVAARLCRRSASIEQLAESGHVVGAPCQRPDDDGIRYWTNCGPSAEADLYHDATNSHCFMVQYGIRVGPCTQDCKGRCGPGCGPGAPSGIFTRDCSEHDQCCRIHGGCTNPWDGQCGDEYFDADDDTLWGNSNCADCGKQA